jgi:hypothetical protein
MGLVRYRAQDDQEADVETTAGGQDGVAQTNEHDPIAKTGAWLTQMLNGHLPGATFRPSHRSVEKATGVSQQQYLRILRLRQNPLGR